MTPTSRIRASAAGEAVDAWGIVSVKTGRLIVNSVRRTRLAAFACHDRDYGMNPDKFALVPVVIRVAVGGLVWADGDLVQVSLPSAAAGPAMIDSAQLVATWSANLSGAAPRILQHLYEQGPASRATIAEALGIQPRGGHWNAAWKELRDNALIEEVEGVARLANVFSETRS